jgi:hypothetical protein
MKRTAPLLVLIIAIVSSACAGILGIKPKDRERPFPHRTHSLAGINCLECHTGITGADATGPLHLPNREKCVSCHTRPHDTRDCTGCHGQMHVRAEAEQAREHIKFTHEKHLKTLAGQCVPCHVNAGKVEQPSMRPGMAQCFACHQHKDQWSTRECDACHHDLPSEHLKPASHVVHDGDFVREHGVRAASACDLCATCHAEPFCAQCHGLTVAALPWRLTFDEPKLSGLHRAGFRLRHSEEARANPGLCTTCHGDGRFCTDCHADRKVGATIGARNPHPAGWVRARGGEHGREARMDPGSCATCHGGSGEALCVGCHRVGGPGGNPHGRGFSSALDRQRDDPCRQCHVP